MFAGAQVIGGDFRASGTDGGGGQNGGIPIGSLVAELDFMGIPWDLAYPFILSLFIKKVGHRGLRGLLRLRGPLVFDFSRFRGRPTH